MVKNKGKELFLAAGGEQGCKYTAAYNKMYFICAHPCYP